MFERFTDQARRVLDLAQEEARLLNHNYVGTEHVLLGLIGEGEGVAAQALESLGMTRPAVRQQVEDVVGRGQQAVPRHIPVTPRAKKVLELALREALQLGQHYIGTEHLLLGLIRESEGVAGQVLVGQGADLDQIRQQVIRLLHGAEGQTRRTARRAWPGQGGGQARGRRPAVLDRVESIDTQLTAIGQRLGAGPELRGHDQQIAQARRGKEAAAGQEDYEAAAALRDRERRLLADRTARQQAWAAEHLDLAALTAELHRLAEEVGQLRELLREPGTGPRDSAA